MRKMNVGMAHYRLPPAACRLSLRSLVVHQVAQRARGASLHLPDDLVGASRFGIYPGFALIIKNSRKPANAVAGMGAETGAPDHGHLAVAVLHRNIFHGSIINPMTNSSIYLFSVFR